MRASLLVLGGAILIASGSASGAPDNGLGDAYSWVPFSEAVALASEAHKPIMLVITKSWCGACKALKPQFAASAEIQALSEKFVMSNAADNDEPTGSQYTPDGGYIPRILFLSPSGEVLSDVINAGGNPSYKYYYSSPSQISASMNAALAATAGAAAEEL